MNRVILIGVVATLLFITVGNASGQRTTRRNLKPLPETTDVVRGDTVFTAKDSSMVSFSGYEKTLRTSRENFFVTNHSSDSLTSLTLEIEYLDMSGRQLDKRPVTIHIDLPPGQTRRADIKSWDRQNVMYYYRSPQPRAKQATPYKVRIALQTALKNSTTPSHKTK